MRTRKLTKFWADYKFSHQIAIHILHEDGTWNLWYDWESYDERYSDFGPIARAIERTELTIRRNINGVVSTAS